jgi:hypothetical protein
MWPEKGKVFVMDKGTPIEAQRKAPICHRFPLLCFYLLLGLNSIGGSRRSDTIMSGQGKEALTTWEQPATRTLTTVADAL